MQDRSLHGVEHARCRWAYLAMFLVALATLGLELLCTRVISAMAYYHLSFFVISLAIVGMTAGALLVYVWGDRFQPDAMLSRFGDAFAISIPVVVACVFAVPIPQSTTVTGMAALGLSAALIAIPFTLSGVLVSVTLTRLGLPYGRIYAADLIGAACGSLLIIPALASMSPGAIAWLLSAAGAAASFAYRKSSGVKGLRPLVLWLATCAAFIYLERTGHQGIVLAYSKDQIIDPQQLSFMGWNTHSFVTVGKVHVGEPFLWGPSPKMPKVDVEQAYLSIDGGAGTHLTRFDGDPTKVDWLFHDVTALAYLLRRPTSAAIIGIGGGRDALTALAAGATRVVGIDVNALVIGLLQGETVPAMRSFLGLADHPAVRLIHDDARSFLTTSAESFDVIQMSLIDTWAASGAGAYTLSENGLYTIEAWRSFANRLTDRGLFTVSRWYRSGGLDETTRCVSMAVELCLERGMLPVRDHLILVSSGPAANLLISRAPLDAEIVARLHHICHERQFDIVIAPDIEPESGLYRELLACTSADSLRAICDSVPIDITPATDDRPYFFNQLRLASFLGLLHGDRAFGGVLGNLRATFTLITVLIISLLALVVGIVLPLRVVGRPKELSPRVLASAIGYFAGIGLGFMLVEMSFVQRFSVLLGHPTYSLAWVIASMVLATGIGSFLADRLTSRGATVAAIGPFAVAAVQVVAWSLLPGVFQATVDDPLLNRVLATLAFTVPCGLVMGTCFPLGMAQIDRFSPKVAPWMWGINGAASVVGTVLSIFTSMTLGISATLLAGVACYIVVGLCAIVLARSAR